ncbi:hypothetical protein Aperf_G00000117987 [Anoplocephala perfoliata]
MKSTTEFNNTIDAIQYHYNYDAGVKKAVKQGTRQGNSLCEDILTGKLLSNSKILLNFDSFTTINNRDIDELHLESQSMVSFTLDDYDVGIWQVRGDLKDIFVDLKPEQTAIIAIVKDSKRQSVGYQDAMDFLTGFLENDLGGIENSPLARTPANWCLWLVETVDFKYLNVMDVYKWASYHILKQKKCI